MPCETCRLSVLAEGRPGKPRLTTIAAQDPVEGTPGFRLIKIRDSLA